MPCRCGRWLFLFVCRCDALLYLCGTVTRVLFCSAQYLSMKRGTRVIRVPKRSSVGTIITPCSCTRIIQRLSSGAHGSEELDDMLASSVGPLRCQLLYDLCIQIIWFAVLCAM